MPEPSAYSTPDASTSRWTGFSRRTRFSAFRQTSPIDDESSRPDISRMSLPSLSLRYLREADSTDMENRFREEEEEFNPG